jgi:asparagine N-glycosylation enzyme membrane subunit Stt3
MLVAATVDFTSSWKSFWTTLSGASGIGVVTKWMAFVGVLLVIFSAVKYIMDRRKGQRGSHIGLILTVILGMILSDPSTFIGYLLDIVDGFCNIVLKAFGG